MKKHLIILSALLTGSAIAYAQESSSAYESWRKQKAHEYSRWQELRAETRGLPVSEKQQTVSSFIDEGFGNLPVTGVMHPAYTAPATAAVPSNMRVWVVVVGVAAYRHIQQLDYTDDDAYRMYAFYKSPEGGSLPDEQIRVLIDEDATRSHVMTAMKEVYSKATENDAIIFFFAGHGSRDAFVTQEYGGMSAENRGLLMHKEIQDIFDRSPARFKYIIADACHSGNWAQQGVKSAAATERQYYHAFERAGGGSILLLSSMGNEYSIENSGIRQGGFRHFLIRGLKGEADSNRDRVVSVTELFDFIGTNVVRSTNHRQTPVLSGDYQGDPPVSIVR
ncbi:MAG: caspase family protein [Tannerellaceae bacterium]|nr:caspase family protein [Tannerellaceae bacterium]